MSRLPFGEKLNPHNVPRKFIFYWLPVYGYMGAIFYLSSLSRPPEQLYLFNWDKLSHCLEYCLLGMLVIRALNAQYSKYNFFHLQFIAFFITAFYGASDEFHQKFVFGRSANLFDWVSDSLGAAIGVFIIFKRRKLKWQG